MIFRLLINSLDIRQYFNNIKNLIKLQDQCPECTEIHFLSFLACNCREPGKLWSKKILSNTKTAPAMFALNAAATTSTLDIKSLKYKDVVCF